MTNEMGLAQDIGGQEAQVLNVPAQPCGHKDVPGWWESVAFSWRQYTKGQIDRAGRALINLSRDDPAREEAIAIVDNWRASHAYPLQVIKMTLLNRAKRINKSALIAQRLKRRPSIETKLRDNPTMKLSQMQDLGGCRAVMPNVKEAMRLVKQYKRSHAKSPKDRSAWDGSDDFDYVKNPKADGYRSVHLIFRFRSPSPERRIYNGQRIEIQIRSRLQHLWATAVETAQVFTGQALKSKVKNASEDWLRFFALVSSCFAHREKCPLVPGTPQDKREPVRELREIARREKIMDSLWGWNVAIRHLEAQNRANAAFFLLVLDPTRYMLSIIPYEKDEIVQAQEEYKRSEKATEDDPTIQVVLVSVESVDALRKAYPNYYVDTEDFMNEVEKEMGNLS